MRFVCEWTEAEVEESWVELDAEQLLEAATRAVPLWPEDQGLPERPESWRPSGSGGWTSSIGSAISEMKPNVSGPS
jgi:hypothetical protein